MGCVFSSRARAHAHALRHDVGRQLLPLVVNIKSDTRTALVNVMPWSQCRLRGPRWSWCRLHRHHADDARGQKPGRRTDLTSDQVEQKSVTTAESIAADHGVSPAMLEAAQIQHLKVGSRSETWSESPRGGQENIVFTLMSSSFEPVSLTPWSASRWTSRWAGSAGNARRPHGRDGSLQVDILPTCVSPTPAWA